MTDIGESDSLRFQQPERNLTDLCRHEAPKQTHKDLRGSFFQQIVPDSSFLAHILHFSLHPNQNFCATACQASTLGTLIKGGQSVPGGMQGSCSLTSAPITPTALPIVKAFGW